LEVWEKIEFLLTTRETIKNKKRKRKEMKRKIINNKV
jgi:hypothetical protein